MLHLNNNTLKGVRYLWDETRAKSIAGDELALFLYRSNLLGQDLRITNYGGGNTSCKNSEPDPLTGENTPVMWIKGSGGDLGTLTRKGIAGLYLNKLNALKSIYRGLEYEDEMVDLYLHCLFDIHSKAPSIDTALHGFLPFKHIDHLHPDALIAIAASRDGESIARDIWGDQMGWIPWQRPGFDLGLKLEACVKNHPQIRGIILAGHGLFTWGDTSFACYVNSLEVIGAASQYLSERENRKPVFGGLKESIPDQNLRHLRASSLMPVLRRFCSSNQRMVGHFSDDGRVLDFIHSHDCRRLAALGTSCPDHFLRTKLRPLYLDLELGTQAGLPEMTSLEVIEKQFEIYRSEYQEYYNENRSSESPACRDPNPVVILCPGVGMFTFAKDKTTARVASEFYLNAINVMRGAESVSSYVALPPSEAFRIEYWSLEEAKLRRLPPEKPLSRKICLVTGAGGGIGRAIADKLRHQGATVVYTDVHQERLSEVDKVLHADEGLTTICDVTSGESIRRAIDFCCLHYGGLDVLVHSAGLAISRSLTETSLQDWDLLEDVLVKGQLLLAQAATQIFRKQALGGDIICVASKNGLVAGPNNVAYGTAKAAQQHMARLLAAELGPEKIRVNTINPDGVIVGSKIWEGSWAEGRAKAHGIPVEDLPAFYASRNLMNEIILPADIAEAVYAILVHLTKSTGNMINVDGGMAPAFVR